MRKVVISFVAASLFLSGCVTGPRSSGQGTVSSVEEDPAVFYTKRECERKYSKSRCVIPVMKEPAEWEVNYIDAGSGREVEAEVSQEVFQSCLIGDFFDGSVCTRPLTPAPAAS